MFQDMAVAYGFVLLGDWQLAEDAAQEAFIAAYCELPALRDTHAFPGWFRQIVRKHSDRIRRRRPRSVGLEAIAHVPGDQDNPSELVEQAELQASVIEAIGSLPAPQREAVTLFYIGTYSQAEISAFLDIPISTLKMRLFHARKQLRAELLARVEAVLPEQRASRDARFVEKTVNFEIRTRDIPAQTIISMQRDTYITDLQAHLDGSIKTLMVYAQASGLHIVGLPMAMYHGSTPLSEEQHGAVEICLPVAGDVRSTIEIAAKELPAARVVYTTTTLRQSIYPGVLKAYEAIREWIRDHGHVADGSPREIYLNFNACIFSPTASMDDPCVEIQRPYN